MDDLGKFHLNVTHGFGVAKEGRNLAVMMSETSMLYSLGRKIVIHDIEHNKQKAIDIGSKVKAITSLQVCPKKRYLAISEEPNVASNPPQVSIIDLKAEKPKRLRTLLNLNEAAELVVTGSKYTDVDFSADSKLIVAVSNEPTFTIVVWDWFRTHRVGSYDVRTMVNRVRFNPFDSGQISSSGGDHFRLWKVQENVLKAYPHFQGVKPGTIVTDHIWTKDDRLIAVTDNASVLIVDEGVVVQNIEKIHSKQGGFTSIIVCTRGLIASGVDCRIVLIDMVAPKKKLDGRLPFRLTASFKGIKNSGPLEIISSSLSPKEDVVTFVFKDNFATFALGDAYLTADSTKSSTNSKNDEGGKTAEQDKPLEVILKHVYDGTHSGSITDMDTCQRKPYLVTCSREDQSLRLWNYRTRVSLATKIFTSDSQRPMSCSIDPTGNIILVCFPGRIQIFYIHVKGLIMDREIICRGARKAYFNHGGGNFVVACGRKIEVYQTHSGIHLGSFQGHSMPIQSIRWENDDLGFVSCGLDGCIYEFKMAALGTNTRSSEHHGGIAGLQFDVLACGDHGSIVAAGCILPSHSSHPGNKKAALDGANKSKGPAFGRSAYGGKNDTNKNGEVQKKVKLLPANTIVRGWKQRPEGPGHTVDMPSRVLSVLMSGHHVFIGMENGSLIVHDWPFKSGQVELKYPAHKCPIVSMTLSKDSNYLFTGGEDGMIMMMTIVNLDESLSGQGHGGIGASAYSALKRPYLDEKFMLTDIDVINSTEADLSDLRANLNEIEGGHRVATELMKTAHAEQIAKMNSDYAIQIQTLEEQESQLKKLLKTNQNETSSILKAKEDRHMKTAKTLEDLYERKISRETSKIEKLNGQLRDALIEKSDIELKMKMKVDELTKKYEAKIDKLVNRRVREKKQQEEYVKYVKTRYEEVREKSETAQDIEIANLKQQIEAEREYARADVDEHKAEIVVLKKSVGMMKEALEDEEEKCRRLEQTRTLSSNKIADLEKALEEQKYKITELDEQGKMKDRQIKTHLRKVGELERVRHVLQHQLHEARGELEPMDREVEAMRDQISELNEEYRKGMRAAAKVEQQNDIGKRKVVNLASLVRKHEAKINSLNSVISGFSYDVEKLITATAPAKWADGVLKLYETYVTKIGKRGGKTGIEENTIQEFNRQRKFMERSVKALKRESNKAAKQIFKVKQKAIVENAELMEELNESRHTCRRLRQEVEKLKSELIGIQTRKDMRQRLAQFKSKSTPKLHSEYNNENNNIDNTDTMMAQTRRRQASRGSTYSNNSAGFGFDRPTTADSIASDINSDHDFGMDSRPQTADTRPQTAESVVSEFENEIREGLERSEPNLESNSISNENKRASVLNQLKRPSQMNRGSASLPRPASSVMLRSQQRPKSGGRPYTASERRRAMGTGGSLAKSMGEIRERRVLGSPEKLLLELETSEMQNVAQGLQIENLRNRLGHALHRTQALETVIAQNGVRMDVGGRVRRDKSKTRPKSSSVGVRDRRGILRQKNSRNTTIKKLDKSSIKARPASSGGMGLKASIVVTKGENKSEQMSKK
jgi:WD40 repeat protein